MSAKSIAKVAAQRKRYTETGLVQINPWVPAEHKARILLMCAQLRTEHFSKQRGK